MTGGGFIVLLFAATLVSLACRRLRLPYTVGLTLAGIILALVPNIPRVELTKSLIFTAFLPPLIFEGAFQIPLDKLRANLGLVLALATAGVLLSVCVLGIGVAKLLGWPVIPAIALAVMLSPTDPVAIMATARQLGLSERLRLIMESESLFNDGTAAVLFGLVLLAFNGVGLSWQQAGLAFGQAVLFGLAGGAAVGIGAVLLAGRTEDHLVELAITTLAAYASFSLAEQLHASGVLATLVSGLIMRRFGSSGGFSQRGQESLEVFWEFAAFLANSFLFILIGSRLAHRDLAPSIVPIIVGTALALAARAAAVYLPAFAFQKSASRLAWGEQHLLAWGGLRGSLTLAFALSLPDGFPHRSEIVDITFAVVGFSVFVQALTIGPLARRLGLQSGTQKQPAPAERAGAG